MSLAKQKCIFFNGIENCLSIFNMDELMELLVNEFDNKIMLYLSTPENIRRYNGDIFQFIYVLNKIEDKNKFKSYFDYVNKYIEERSK